MLEFRNEEIEDFVGFCTDKGFWVGERIDVFDKENGWRLSGMVPEIAICMESEQFTALICIDGLILLRVKELSASMPNMSDTHRAVQWWEEHIDYINALLVFMESESNKCTQSGNIELSSISIDKTCRVGIQGGRPVRRVHIGEISRVRARQQASGWLVGGDEKTMPSVEWTGWDNCTVVSENAIEAGLTQFEHAISNPTLIKRLSFIAQAKSAFTRNDFRSSFILLWFVIEAAVKDMLLLGGETIDSNQPSISSVLRRLKTRGLMSAELFSELDDLRKRVRNKLMHESQTATCLPSDCMIAAGAVITLVQPDLATAIDLRWSFSVAF
ncbi:hypothetical protein [Rhodoferax saidenbachensis]|uniref:Apea-like HEPN domain-containing protein n=1 Tax=Rhodoferax saidenbachensis TaxID=1484693 RepID=A0A1P8KAB2_9BURK|nr:hypothetical protein [Rhodoferax saidenbachensis]APW42922.1 hypothetical protein RS694_10510 [Rhodoferax saidenbachensis]